MRSLLLLLFVAFAPCCLLAQFFSEGQIAAGIDHYVKHRNFMGGGAAFFDADLDGDEDLYLTSGNEPDQYYQNNGDGTFSLASSSAGFLNNTIASYNTGVTAADVNNDGYKDLFVITWGSDTADLAPNILFYNNGDGTFTEQVFHPEDAAFSIGATFLDYDLDGWLDLYVVNYVAEANFLYEENVIVGFDHTCFDNYFYRNNGDGTFTKSTDEVGLSDTGCALATAATDFDADGDLDLYIANDFGEFIQPNKLYQNNSATFTEVGAATGADVPMYGMGIAIGDIDKDLDLDYYVTNFGKNALLRNEGGQFTNITDLSLTGDEWVDQDSTLTVGWGTAFLDIDNDTDLDLWVSNGYVPGPNFLPSPLFMNDKLFLNDDGELPFMDTGESYGISNRWASRGMAYSDVDNDGDLDILSVVLNVPMNSTGYATLLYKNNEGNQNNWLQVELEGVEANRDGIGSKVIAYANGEALLREVDGGSSHASHVSTRLHFGLADASAVDSLQVIWPGGGRTQTLYDVAANQFIDVVEDTTIAIVTNLPTLTNLSTAVEVFPNPTNDRFNLKWTAPRTLYPVAILLVDAHGRRLEHWNAASLASAAASVELDLSKYPKGLYQVGLQLENEIVWKKIIKQ
ncbi:MAG: FG-GAP-like repeat-containing protein [Bacteroidota bacterium]